MSSRMAEYTDHITTTPDPTTDNYDRPAPYPILDDDHSDEGGYYSPSHTVPPNPFTDPYPRPGRRTSAQSSRRRMTWGDRAITRADSANTQDLDIPPVKRMQRIKTSLSDLLMPRHKVGKSPGFVNELKSILFGTWFNVFLLAIPVSWALHFAKPQEYTLVFVFSFFAIMPLAKLLAFATDELSIRVGETLAGLLNATLGNAVELIVAILALVKCELRVVQSSLVGSILSNLLLVLGICFFAGGTKFSEQGFALGATQLNSSLLTLSIIAVLIPVGFDVVTNNSQIRGFDSDTEQRDILKLSRGTAIVLLFIYLSYLYFQLFSHKSLYDDKSGQKPETVKYAPRTGPSAKEKTKKLFGLSPVREARENGTIEAEDDEGDEEIPELSLPMTLGLLVVVTFLVAITAEWLVDSIDGLASGGGISKEFIGLILLPIVGNAAEHVTAVTVSVKDKLTLSLGVAVGSSVQIALFVIPFTIILGWIIGRPITMLFDPLESVVLFLSVLTVNYVVQDGKSNWLEGMILICLYVIAALVFWFYPGTELTGLLKCSA